MRTPSAARRHALTIGTVLLALLPAMAGADAPAPATALSPDQRPTLVIVADPAPLLVVHHAHPLPPNKAEQLALKLGLFIAGPIIRRLARAGADPLPKSWRSGDPDRGFTAALEAALDRPQANWPWRALRIVGSESEADDVAAQLKGQDVAVVTFDCALDDWMRTVQYDARARIELLRAVGTPWESRTEFSVRHLARPLPADWGSPRKYAEEFRSGGPLDQSVNAAALDLSRALAVTVARLTTATPNIQIAGREFGQLLDKPRCPECRPSDTVLHEEPGRVWVAPSSLPGTVLSLPVGPSHAQVAREGPGRDSGAP